MIKGLDLASLRQGFLWIKFRCGNNDRIIGWNITDINKACIFDSEYNIIVISDGAFRSIWIIRIKKSTGFQ